MPRHVVFLGTPAFAVPSLQALLKAPDLVVDLVITQPDKPVGRKQLLTAPPVKVEAEQHDIPVFQPIKLNAEWTTYKEKIPKPDFLITVAYGQLLSAEVLAWPTVAPLNVHASLLPKYRGASPIQETLLQGDRETGITIQRMVKELDSGPILHQKSIAIDERETAETLRAKLSALGAAALIEMLGAPIQETAQRDDEATFCRKLTRTDGIVDAKTMTAEEIDRKVRALTPWPGVRYGDIKLIETQLNQTSDAYVIDCKNGTKLYVTQIQPDGKKVMRGGEYARGRKI